MSSFPLKPNSISLSWLQTGPRLVADLQRAGIWPITSSELARASRSATSLRPVCDHDNVMEFGLDQLRTGLRPGSNRFELSRHAEIVRTCSILVADRFEAKFNYAILVAELSQIC